MIMLASAWLKISSIVIRKKRMAMMGLGPRINVLLSTDASFAS